MGNPAQSRMHPCLLGKTLQFVFDSLRDSHWLQVLQQWLLLGVMPAAELRPALARIGGGGLVTETVKLAEMLQAIAAVSEAVHDDVYARLASDLL